MQPAPAPCALFALFCLGLPIGAYSQGAGVARSLLLAALLVVLLVVAGRQLLGLGPQAPRQLHWDAQGQFSLVLADGGVEPVCLQPGSLASSRWLWLVLRGRNRYHLFIDRHHSDPSAFATIRRRLRTFPPAGGL